MNRYALSSDTELTVLLTQGDEIAFTEIYSRYSRKLMAMGYNYAKDSTLAEEIVQEVFIQLWEKRQQVEINTLSAYLATAIKFSVFRVIQRKRRQEAIAQEHYTKEDVVHDDERIYAKFLEEYINGITEELPEKCKLVFHYSRNLHMTNKEISEELNIAEKTVEAHLTKAIKNVRKGLEGLGVSAILINVFIKYF
ncbi:RNA polymerase sigma-70 factor [Sphingobacterium chuzhouense]|uniref:RNA polymerase sigma-70 factor n=1 Tax=Sphingobacterium chuzhouense TaxID=1742264 RepID=A0ABR7XVN4_9SPHI|nr:RNA polymerase sigma-70 factor [Sphingobacterium chuzhouense]MBD1423116.1 RNA polymerase sigma-70 factor [Sphingobacterium chuzhouense]